MRGGGSVMVYPVYYNSLYCSREWYYSFLIIAWCCNPAMYFGVRFKKWYRS